MNISPILKKSEQHYVIRPMEPKGKLQPVGGFKLGSLAILLAETSNQSTTVDDLCRFYYGRVSDANLHLMRQKVSYAKRTLLKYNLILLVKAGPTGAARAVKLFDPSSEADKTAAKIQCDAMEAAGEIKHEQADKMRALIGL